MLTPKQQRFVEEYLIDLNASAAARRAGYSVRTSEQQGARLLVNVQVSAAIATAKATRSERTQIDADWVLRTLAAEKTADLADLYDENGNLLPVREWPEVWRRGVVTGVESFEEYDYDDEGVRRSVGRVRKVRLSDRIKHIELIGKHVDVQAFREQHGHGGMRGGPIPLAAVSMTHDEFRQLAAEIAAKT